MNIINCKYCNVALFVDVACWCVFLVGVFVLVIVVGVFQTSVNRVRARVEMRLAA
jgi:fucose permease